ncbi:hypothetical protein [Nocardioides sp. 1609]|uniref:hypothetical protein n=1 Tax=Nocardioides sp. 1609 TaxID=2508327 RepID=UPI00106F36B5|nr:hypothetical protein [Nocardioides sp. 1609]
MGGTTSVIAQLRATLALALAAAFALVVPSIAATTDTSATVALAVVALAAAALASGSAASGVVQLRTTAIATATRRVPPVALTSRVTDPVHHPLRPRAPGTD